MPCSVVTARETWILSCLLLAAYTGEWWTVCFSTLHWQALIEQYAGQKAGLSVYHAVWMFTMDPWNHFIVCHSISPLIPLPLYLALVCIWIVRAVLRPPRPWNIVCCVILTWAEHSGSVFPIVLFFFFFFISLAHRHLDCTIRHCYINYQWKLVPPAKAGHALTAEAPVQVLVSNAVLSVWTDAADVGQRMLIRSWDLFIFFPSGFLSFIYSLVPICSLQYFHFLKLLFSFMSGTAASMNSDARELQSRMWCEPACV